jgi:hypothetical protein
MANPWLPHWGDPAVRFDRGWRWPTEAEIAAAKIQPTLKGKMRQQRYFPGRTNNQIPWLRNFAAKLPGYETLLSLPPAHVDACVASCLYVVYVLEQWLAAVRVFGPAATEAVDLLMSGSGPTAVVLPVFTAPALPEGVASVPPGALNRLFDLVTVIKNSPGYNNAIGEDLGIVAPAPGDGAFAPDTQAAPGVRLQVIRGETCEAVKINFIKHGHQGVCIERQRGDGAWEFVAIDTESPYLDDLPLLAAGQPEVRKYRLRFWDKGTPNGDWSDIATVTVSP